MTKWLKHDTINTSKGTNNKHHKNKGKKEEKKMAIIKKDGFVVGAVKANEIDVKRLEENGFVVIIK